MVACQGNEPSEKDVAAFERVCGLRLPDERRVLPVSFSELLMQEIRDLEERARRKAAGEDKR